MVQRFARKPGEPGLENERGCAARTELKVMPLTGSSEDTGAEDSHMNVGP